jgi:molybdenum cofactor guanylyltransferase
MKILGVIIAGGQSRRMGTEKAFVLLDGVGLMQRVLSRLRFQVKDVIINANGETARFDALELVVVHDSLDIGTPLAGLHAGLSYAHANGFDAVVTVGSDQPFLPLDLVAKLEKAGRETGAAVAHSNGQTHYLTGMWSSALAPELAAQIGLGMRRVQDFVRHVDTQIMEWPSHDHDPFFNINTPEDLAEAAAILRLDFHVSD